MLQVKIWFQNRRMKWRNSKERELLSSGGSREATLPNKGNPNPDLSDVKDKEEVKEDMEEEDEEMTQQKSKVELRVVEEEWSPVASPGSSSAPSSPINLMQHPQQQHQHQLLHLHHLDQHHLLAASPSDVDSDEEITVS